MVVVVAVNSAAVVAVGRGAARDVLAELPNGDFGLEGNLPRLPFRLSVRTPSRTMPTSMHFL